MTEIKTRSELYDAVVAVKKDDDEAFARIVSAAGPVLKISDRDLARKFGVSQPTVGRWKKAIAMPEPTLREPVFDFIRDRAERSVRKRQCR